MSEYLEFKLYKELPKTKVFNVINKKSENLLGRIGWYPQWRQYVFIPAFQTIYSSGCLKDIKDFIDNLMIERKNNDE